MHQNERVELLNGKMYYVSSDYGYLKPFLNYYLEEFSSLQVSSKFC